MYAVLFQEEIEYTRALDDQDGSSFWRPSLLQFNNITFYLQVTYFFIHWLLLVSKIYFLYFRVKSKFELTLLVLSTTVFNSQLK